MYDKTDGKGYRVQPSALEWSRAASKTAPKATEAHVLLPGNEILNDLVVYVFCRVFLLCYIPSYIQRPLTSPRNDNTISTFVIIVHGVKHKWILLFKRFDRII